MPQLPNTPRPSKIQSLEDLYRTVDANPAIGIRSHIINRTGKMAWGLSKDAGDPTYMSTNKFSDTQYTRTFQPSSFITRITANGGFNNFALEYAKNTLRHDNTLYRG